MPGNLVSLIVRGILRLADSADYRDPTNDGVSGKRPGIRADDFYMRYYLKGRNRNGNPSFGRGIGQACHTSPAPASSSMR